MSICRTSVVTLGLMLALSGGGAAQGDKPSAPEEYTARTMNMTPGAGTTLSFQILRWQSDADRQKVLEVVAAAEGKKADELEKALTALPTVGYIWTQGNLGYSLKYAHRVVEPDRSERIVVITERPLGSWEAPRWKPTGQIEPVTPFTVVEMRINNKGKGEGKMSLTTPMAVDEGSKTIGLTNYDAATPLLTDVQRKAKSITSSQS